MAVVFTLFESVCGMPVIKEEYIFATALTDELRTPPQAHWLSVEPRILIILTFSWALPRLEKFLPSGSTD